MLRPDGSCVVCEREGGPHASAAPPAVGKPALGKAAFGTPAMGNPSQPALGPRGRRWRWALGSALLVVVLAGLAVALLPEEQPSPRQTPQVPSEVPTEFSPPVLAADALATGEVEADELAPEEHGNPLLEALEAAPPGAPQPSSADEARP